MSPKEKVKILRRILLKWYRNEKRNLPWRDTKDPYYVWVSEVMLQQTRVKTVIPYYHRWVKEFPTLKSFAKARETRVLKYWEGLGYYSRVRNFHRAAKIVVNKYKGQIPDTFEKISKLPGVGRYTAGAVLSIAFNKPFPVLDGNVKRVLSRWFCVGKDLKGAILEDVLWERAAHVLSKRSPGNFNQAMMELGAMVCLPKNPICLLCPVKKICEAWKQKRQTEFPLWKIKTVSNKIEVSAAVIWQSGKVYIQKRPINGLMGGLWEFPGGKIEKGESPEECLVREIKEELGIEVKIEKKLMTIKHAYTKFLVTLHVFQCRISSKRVKPSQCEKWCWAKPTFLKRYPFPAANSRIVHYITQNEKA